MRTSDLFQNSYYWIDLLIGFGSPVLIYILCRSGKIAGRNWRLFWLGALIGASWEIPIFMLSKLTSFPIVAWIREFPIHYSFFMVSHTLWDGALFLAGVWLVALAGRPPTLTRFRWSELGVLTVWGQVSAFLVEFSSVYNEAWTFIAGYWWNPTLLAVGHHQITLMMQLIWFVAIVGFYLIAISPRIRRVSKAFSRR